MLQKLFTVIAILAIFNSFYKTDLNLALFVFAYLVWDYPQDQKCFISYLILFTSITDLIYLLTYVPFYKNLKQNKLDLIENYTLFMSTLIVTLKLILFFLLLKQHPHLKHAFTPEGIKDNITKAFTFS